MKRLYIIVWGVFCTLHTFAQFHFDINVTNNHLWRGIEVADGLVVTSDVSYTLLKGHVNVGVWGGTNTTGRYKEFNYHASFQAKGFSLALWDTYNFSPDATYNNKEFFNYKASETGRFLDAIVAYRFGGKFPLYVSWSSIIAGRDQNDVNTANKYSSFCYVEYPVYRMRGWTMEVGAGGAFALSCAGSRKHFYGNTPGIVHISAKVSRNILLGDYTFPVYACAVWNPQADRAYLQVGVRLFSLDE